MGYDKLEYNQTEKKHRVFLYLHYGVYISST